MGVQNFLSVALASARSRLGPFISELVTYVYNYGRNAKNGHKREKPPEKSPFFRDVNLEWFCNRKSGQRVKNGTFRALFGGFSSLFRPFLAPSSTLCM